MDRGTHLPSPHSCNTHNKSSPRATTEGVTVLLYTKTMLECVGHAPLSTSRRGFINHLLETNRRPFNAAKQQNSRREMCSVVPKDKGERTSRPSLVDRSCKIASPCFMPAASGACITPRQELLVSENRQSINRKRQSTSDILADATRAATRVFSFAQITKKLATCHIQQPWRF